MVSPIIPLLAVALDRIIGDAQALYRFIPHPVHAMTIYYRWAESGFNRVGLNEKQRTQFGAGILILYTGSLILLAVLLEHLMGLYLPNFLVIAIVAWLASTMIAMSSLVEQIHTVQMPLAHDDIMLARRHYHQFSHEDADEFEKTQLIKKTIGTSARYFAEGVVAPIFWLILLGLPGLVFFTALTIAVAGADEKDDDPAGFYNLALTLHGLMLWIPNQVTAFLIALSAIADGLKWMRASFRNWVTGATASEDAKPYICALAGALDLDLISAVDAETASSEVEVTRRQVFLGDLNNMLTLLERTWTLLLCLAFMIVFLDAFLFEGVFV